MKRHRPTARVVLTLLLLWVLAATAHAHSGQHRILFPVIGDVLYYDDFGESRGQGPHEGNDIVAERGRPVIAAEGGKIEFSTTSARAGCMLYLYGRSGTTYIYVHLNNDLTEGNDNRGKCVPGVAYAPGLRNGQRVRPGQLIGFVGDSGDANGIHPHLHFELHPDDGAAVSPFFSLRSAQQLLFAAPALDGEPAPRLALYGTVLGMGQGTLTVRVGTVRMSNGWRFQVRQDVTLAVPEGTVVERAADGKRLPASAGTAGEPVVVWTAPLTATLDEQLGKPGALTAAQILFRGES
jgi:hypothetical protein